MAYFCELLPLHLRTFFGSYHWLNIGHQHPMIGNVSLHVDITVPRPLHLELPSADSACSSHRSGTFWRGRYASRCRATAPFVTAAAGLAVRKLEDEDTLHSSRRDGAHISECFKPAITYALCEKHSKHCRDQLIGPRPQVGAGSAGRSGPIGSAS